MKTLKQILDEGVASAHRPVMTLMGNAAFDTMGVVFAIRDEAEFLKEAKKVMPEDARQREAILADAKAFVGKVLEERVFFSSVDALARRFGHESSEVLARSLTRLAMTNAMIFARRGNLEEAAVQSAGEDVRTYLRLDGLIQCRHLGG